MTGSPNLLTTIFAFLLVLGPLVVIHELGHYLVGRLFGVKANVFSVGFGKELAGWTDRRGTRWKLSALPLGGYVQFAGDMNAASAPSAEDDGLTPAERAQTFHVKPLWQRALIVLAGPVTNLLFAVAIIAGFNYAHGRLVSPADVATFTENSPAEAAGVQIGDRIVTVDGNKVDSFADLREYIVPYPGQTVALGIRRDGRELSLPVALADEKVSDEFGNESRMGDLGVDFVLPIVGDFTEDSAGKAAGLQLGDRIVAIDGKQVHGFSELPELVFSRPGETVSVTVNRDGRDIVLPVTLGSREVTDGQGKTARVGLIGIRPAIDVQPVGPAEAVRLGFEDSFGIMRMMATGIGQIFSGERSVKELGGPIKIAKYSGEQFSLGWADFIGFVALISINLAFINLLPIPGLDGGHLAFYAAETVRRKPLSLRSQEWAIRMGVALVLALMVFVTVNDVASLPIFGG
ncbi:zinc metalloprotease [Novosphingobium endophyticum]|uniref:Zinc metalloprotease n=1 Tax=Novosphingobium endophyticum TaxID=1955250 RepID=A0A916TT98_9SPHN|nr:RIP metalloprotease RseP [Novosphingobium endophyticum]GGB94377.1 zinc metalloprotease [Novosphingobium endophyticum]